MKKIFLIGDSIRLVYDKYVQESMQNVAQVYFPEENCRFSSYILRSVHSWAYNLKLYDVDAVHWNAGLWDTIRIYGDDTFIRPEVYADNLERIQKRLEFLFPNAVSIFATTTPVIESGFIEEFETRHNSDVRHFNEIACEVLTKRGVIINDLYRLMENTPDSYHSDQTHYYTAEATELLGGQVNTVLCDALHIDKSLLIAPDKNKFIRTDRLNDLEMFEKHGNIYIPKE